MFCKKCGCELNEGAKFCPKCGTPVAVQASAPVQPARGLADRSPEPSPEPIIGEDVPEPKKKKGPLILVIVLLIVLILAASFAAFWFLGGKPMITGFLDNTFGTSFSDSSDTEEDEEEWEDEEEDASDEDEADAEEEQPAVQAAAETAEESISYDTGERDETAEALRKRAEERENAESRSQNDVAEERDDTYERQDTYEREEEQVVVNEAPAEEEEEDLTPELDEDEFIFYDSDQRYLTKADLRGLDADECRIARNEIYARRGRKFKDAELQAYFDSKSWYHGTVEPNDFQESWLNDYEKQNCILITQYEKEQGYR
ncbi:MAG: YARHG domain-containing protein [Lachnospiraceae bacterium]|nr:YARHG domain-containing protein [Lachnospiraceae bacterium]